MKPSPVDIAEWKILQAGGEARKRGQGQDVAPVTHRFTPGLYIREIFMRKSLVVSSHIHKTEHPFVVSQGKLLVYREDQNKSALIEAPHTGITKPGTRRLLVILEDTIWTTFHPTKETDVGVIEDQILVKYENPLLDYSGELPQIKPPEEVQRMLEATL